jgi:GAF domain-containing protein
MLTTGTQNLPEPLARVQAAYHGTARLAPASADRLARRVEHFASSVQFVLEDSDAARRLHALTKDLRTIPRLGTLLPQVLRGAMALVGGDFGNIQIVDPATGSLLLVTQAGFGPEFLGYFAVVEDVHSICGRAARQGAQTAVADVRADPGFTPHREIAAATGFRAVQSTPLVDYAGHLIGMVSTHFQRPHRPSDRDLRIMELYADFASEALTAHLGRPSGDSPADPVGRAFVTALLDPAHVGDPDVSVPFELWVMGRMTVSFARRAGRRGPARPARQARLRGRSP